MPSKAESSVVFWLEKELADLNIGAELENSEEMQNAEMALEYYLPEVLREKYPEWQKESLDAFYPLTRKKTGVWEFELFGYCILITNQTLTPIHLRLQLGSTPLYRQAPRHLLPEGSPENDQVSWLHCRLGEIALGRMIRIPYSVWRQTREVLLPALEGRADAIQWAYDITWGERQ